MAGVRLTRTLLGTALLVFLLQNKQHQLENLLSILMGHESPAVQMNLILAIFSQMLLWIGF